MTANTPPHTDYEFATHVHISGNGQWRWAVLPLPSDYLMVWLVDEEKSMVAALREVMWYVEKSLARVAFDTSDVAARLGWNGRDERRSGLGNDPWE